MVARKETNDARLDRIEEKIDKLSDAMILLARAEEKLIQIEKNNAANFERMNRFSQKLDHIEKKVDDNARTVSIINKLMYIIGVAVVGAIINQFWM